MKCRICGGKITPEDPLYPRVHYRCANKVYKELERFKIIRVIKKQGTLVWFEIRSSFFNLLKEETKAVYSHILTDETVDEDILELWAVVKAVSRRVPQQTPQERIITYCEIIFNNLMTLRYGRPVPEDKKFHSRMKEFAKEIYTVEIDKEQFDFMKRIGRYAA